jgi:hypothetical protein
MVETIEREREVSGWPEIDSVAIKLPQMITFQEFFLSDAARIDEQFE